MQMKNNTNAQNSIDNCKCTNYNARKRCKCKRGGEGNEN